MNALQPAAVSVCLQELVVPLVCTFVVKEDLTGCTFVCKVRLTLPNAVAIVTLVSPGDIALTVVTALGVTTSTVAVTFTAAHFTALLAALGSNVGVVDCLATPPVGAPQLLFSGDLTVERTVSR